MAENILFWIDDKCKKSDIKREYKGGNTSILR